MSSLMKNAAPMTIQLGMKDSSTTAASVAEEAVPSHLPKVMAFAKKGPTSDQLVVGSSRTSMYGSDTFDLRSKYATHQTVLSNILNDQANAQIFRRLKPQDAGPRASIRIYLDVLPTAIKQYRRGTDGKYMLDRNGNKIETGDHLDGYKVKWIAKPIDVEGGIEEVVYSSTYDWETSEDGDAHMSSPFNGSYMTVISASHLQVKNGTEMAGTMVTTDRYGYGGEQSTMYPIFDIVVPFFGADGNNTGFRLFAPTDDSTLSINKNLLTTDKIYPLIAQFLYKDDTTQTSTITSTVSGSQYVDVALKPDAINTTTDEEVYIGTVLVEAFQSLDDPTTTPIYSPFGEVYVYENNLEMLIKQFYEAEIDHIGDGFTDFDESDDEEWRFNILSGVTSANQPYHTYEVNYSDTDSVRFSEHSTIYASGGSDGTTDDAMLNKLVTAHMAVYADELSEYTDSALHPESIIYDSGFDLNTKKALAQFISVRKDTFAFLSTHVAGETLTEASEYSRAVSLNAYLKNYPESAFWGTKTVRGLVMGRSGKLLNSKWRGTLPISMEIASKAAACMGASDGIWKQAEFFDRYPNSMITMFKEPNVVFIGASVRNRDWEVGLNWVGAFARRQYFIPALKTIYGGDSLSDTSVLNGFLTVLLCCELNKIGQRIWREFSGSSTLTDDQFIDTVNARYNELIKDRFTNVFTIIPNAFISPDQKKRGYAWTLQVKVGAPNMKTVEELYLDVYRKDDLDSATSSS